MSPFTLGKVEAVWHIWCTIADFTNAIITSEVRISHHTTEPSVFTRGLLQVCVLLPTLFKIYINDLPQSLGCHAKGVVFGRFYIYADDLAILVEDIDMSDPTCALEEWCERWQIQRNLLMFISGQDIKEDLPLT